MEIVNKKNGVLVRVTEMETRLAELASTFNRLKTILAGKDDHVPAVMDDFFIVKPIGNECKVVVWYKDVVWVEAENISVHIHLSNSEPISVSCTIKEIKDFLPGNRFVRINRSEIINICYLSKICGNLYYLNVRGNKRRFIATDKYREQIVKILREL